MIIKKSNEKFIWDREVLTDVKWERKQGLQCQSGSAS